jgi:hypothetical protein
VILGLQLREILYPARALRFDDVRVLAVIPTEITTKDTKSTKDGI